MSEATTARIDAWLWSVRIFKSRSLATSAVKAGHVRVNGASVKPSTALKIGDRVTVTGVRERILVVQKLLNKRVGAPLAVEAYLDESPPPPPREERPAPVALRERGAGRPTKRDRRRLDRFREQGRPTDPWG